MLSAANIASFIMAQLITEKFPSLQLSCAFAIIAAMKTSFCSIAFQQNKWGANIAVEVPLPEILPALAGAGYDGVEIWAPHVMSMSDAALDDLRRQLDDLRLTVPMLSPYFNFTLSDESATQSLAHAQHCLRVARRITAIRVRCFTGNTGSADARPDHWSRAVTSLRTLADEAAADGIGLALEIHSRNLMDTLESTLRLLREIDRANVGLIYHAGNFLATHTDAIALLGSAITHVHARNELDKKACSLADGDVDYTSMIAQLRQAGFDGYLSVEWMGADPMGVARREAKFLRGLVTPAALG
jgi:sugar phosphate isomerase/epimerase